MLCGEGDRIRSPTMRLASLLCFGIAVWSSLWQAAESSVHQYSRKGFVETGNAYLFHGGSEGMHAPRSQAITSGIANGKSYIRFDSVKFLRTAASSPGLIQAIIFEASDRGNIGGSEYGGRVAICCTADLSKQEGCKEGEVIIRPSTENADWPFSIRVQFEGDSLEATMHSETVNISKTGMYNLYFVLCDPGLKGLIIDGTTIWKNPTGYLPGRMAPLMSFYGLMSLAYLVLGMAWFFQCFRFWKDMLDLQNYLTFIIALGMLEVTLWYFEYANFNAKGLRPMGITIWAVTVGVVKSTVSSLLILVVSMGYGVVRPTLGGLTSKVILLGATYFLASEVLGIFENVGAINDLSGKARLFIVLPVAILNAFFVLWIFTSLSKTLEKLQARRMTAKLELYRKFTNALAVSVVVSVAWIGYEFYFNAGDPFSERWQNAWVMPAFWSILSFVLLCVICALWAPSQNSTRYSYSAEGGENLDDEDAVLMKSIVIAEPEKPNPKLDKKEKKPINTDVFSLEDNQEEDKRE